MSIDIKNKTDSTWDNSMSNAKYPGTIFQSTYWADFMNKNFGDVPYYFSLFDNRGDLQAQALVFKSTYCNHTFKTQIGLKGLALSSLYKSGMPIFRKSLPFFYWENGPVLQLRENLQDSKKSKEYYYQILQAIQNEALKANCYSIKFSRPPFFNDQPELFTHLNYLNKRMGTVLVNLDKSESEIWAAIDKDARRTVRRGIEQGVRVTLVNDMIGLSEFYDLVNQTARRSHTKIYPFSYFFKLWKFFAPIKKLVIFNAYMGKMPVSTGLFLIHNGMIHFFAIGEADYCRTNKIYACEVLCWNAIKWSYEQRLKQFDFSGLELHKIDAGDTKAIQISRFKRKWGGEVVEYHDYEKSIRNNVIINLTCQYLSDNIIHN